MPQAWELCATIRSWISTAQAGSPSVLPWVVVITTPEGLVVDSWLDTNVSIEVDSQGDLIDAGERSTLLGTGPLEYRRVRIRGALWMSMALCRRGAVSIQYQHETVRNLVRTAPPGTPRGWWTEALIYVLRDGGVFDGWARVMTNDHADLGNRGRDRQMVEECRVNGLLLITRDEQVIREAGEAGVRVARPEEHARDVMSLDAARRMFFQRLDIALLSHLTLAHGDIARERRAAACRDIATVYQNLWADEVDWSHVRR